MRRRWGALAMSGLTLGCAGCSHAPSFDILGSYFPVWMLCLTLAVVLTFGARGLLLRFRLEEAVGPLVLFYPSAVVLLTCLLWLIFFR
jgi:hypothetical protein